MTKLISADSHVAIRLEEIRERVPQSLHEAFDDAIANQARIDEDLRLRHGCCRQQPANYDRAF